MHILIRKYGQFIEEISKTVVEEAQTVGLPDKDCIKYFKYALRVKGNHG